MGVCASAAASTGAHDDAVEVMSPLPRAGDGNVAKVTEQCWDDLRAMYKLFNMTREQVSCTPRQRLCLLERAELRRHRSPRITPLTRTYPRSTTTLTKKLATAPARMERSPPSSSLSRAPRR